ncbi:hypothetical protein SLEP1_g3236 [Rubroshorea leprosula]|uniref:Uncharacterized protein n=1 Tax=Rubroshorea leprosula TaxID=152421 RepID=A0AAV5HSZ2_9ROSI|nr:hypothetical protein SLEP1_g3236 [Rubroshorea leprosula]
MQNPGSALLLPSSPLVALDCGCKFLGFFVVSPLQIPSALPQTRQLQPCLLGKFWKRNRKRENHKK